MLASHTQSKTNDLSLFALLSYAGHEISDHQVAEAINNDGAALSLL